MKTQKVSSKKKEVEAGQNVKRPETPKHKSTVNGTTNFENGKLVLPKTTEKEITAFVEKKEKLSAEKKVQKPKKKAKESIPDEEDPKWNEYITINHCSSQAKREEIKKLITAGLALPDVAWSKVGGDFKLKTHGRVILHICALSKVPEFSAMVPSLGPKMKRYTMEEVLKALPASHEKFHKVPARVPNEKGAKQKSPTNQLSGKEMVTILKAKVESTSDSSKGFIKPPAVKLTDPRVKEFIKQNGYSTTGNTILLNRV